jgi:hypothetical protein
MDAGSCRRWGAALRASLSFCARVASSNDSRGASGLGASAWLAVGLLLWLWHGGGRALGLLSSRRERGGGL